MPKSLVFFTHAPQGTLGDPSAASKLIKSLKKKYGDDIDITITLIVDEKNEDMVKNIFKDLPITVLLMPKLNLKYKGHDTRGVKRDLNGILKKSDGIIFFPTFHHFDKSDISEVKGYHKPSFIVTEYDLHPANRKTQSEKLGDFKSRCMEIDTGLAEKNLGIFCTEETDAVNNRTTLPQISGSDLAFRNVLLGSGDPSKYHDTHQLFFGYFNKLNMESPGHKVDPVMFIDTCLKIRDDNKDTIDFVLPLADKVDDHNTNKSMPNIKKYFANNPSLLKGYRYEYWKKDGDGKMVCLDTGGTGAKLIRVINGYPFTPDTMDKLMKGSEDFVMVTGDQSLSEAISNGKIFIYQSMSWKDDLWDSLRKLVKDTQGNSKLFQFLEMQDRKSPASVGQLADFLKNNKAEIQADVYKLRQQILVEKNLYNNLPKRLMDYMSNSQEYLRDCMAKNEKLSYEQIKGLIKLYPHEVNTIFTIINEGNKYDPNMDSFVTALNQDEKSYDSATLASIKSMLDIKSAAANEPNAETTSPPVPNDLPVPKVPVVDVDKKVDQSASAFSKALLGIAALGVGGAAGYFLATSYLATLGGAVGTFFGGPIGAVVGAVAFALVGLAVVAVAGVIASKSGLLGTKETEALDYKEVEVVTYREAPQPDNNPQPRPAAPAPSAAQLGLFDSKSSYKPVTKPEEDESLKNGQGPK